MHVASNYYDMKSNKTFVSHERYMNTLGQYEDRLKNLHFIFAAVLRAVKKASNILVSYNYDTQLDEEGDKKTIILMD
jgi:hypothetical protein